MTYSATLREGWCCKMQILAIRLEVGDEELLEHRVTWKAKETWLAYSASRVPTSGLNRQTTMCPAYHPHLPKVMLVRARSNEERLLRTVSSHPVGQRSRFSA